MANYKKIFCLNHSLAASARGFTASGTRKVQDCSNIQYFHKTLPKSLPQAAHLKLPSNVVDINSAETGRFSPLRSRDLSGPVISAHQNIMSEFPKIDITLKSDPHVGSYDCRGAVSLSSSMQSNVPSPFTGNNIRSHLGMPGGQWGQGYKYLSEHLNSSHYLTLRNECRKANSKESDNKPAKLSTKEKFKAVFKEYGATVIIFHTAISLASLGACYLAVSSGIDPVAVLNWLNISEGPLTKTFMSKSSTFVIAFAFHKMFMPLRISLTITFVPFIVNYLRRKGLVKVRMRLFSFCIYGMDPIAVLKWMNINDGALTTNFVAKSSTFVIAYAFHKIFAPLRMAITATSVPFIVTYLRKRGILKVKQS